MYVSTREARQAFKQVRRQFARRESGPPQDLHSCYERVAHCDDFGQVLRPQTRPFVHSTGARRRQTRGIGQAARSRCEYRDEGASAGPHDAQDGLQRCAAEEGKPLGEVDSRFVTTTHKHLRRSCAITALYVNGAEVP